MQNEMLSRLSEWLAGAIGGASVKVVKLQPSQHGWTERNWSVLAEIDGTSRSFIVRKSVPTAPFGGHIAAEEFALLQVAHERGVTVPGPIAFCDDPNVLGSHFALLENIDGASSGPHVVRDVSLGGDRSTLAQRLGRELAKMHHIRPPVPRLSFLDAPTSSPAATEIERMRSIVDRLTIHRPALEWGLRWAEINSVNSERITLVHSDFHTGNYALDARGLTAVLEWHFAGWGDPLSDLGSFCAECWRFGRNDLEAGGIGERSEFYDGYERESRAKIDDTAVRYWEVVAHLRRAVRALQMDAQHRFDREPSLAFALNSRVMAEIELAIVRATAPVTWRTVHGS
jgi:aminoglycoside phosphotransferase (APT) family kinase protein